ncbi:MAG TPA: hypothetical protein VLT86_05655 [Vicinamibacterales bacterium]|nr:hypothetical protein [Vicinamibacterales bacterium]
MRRAARVGSRDEPIEDRPALPEQLVDAPGGLVRFLERTDRCALGAELLRKRVSRRRELGERQLVEPIDLVVVGSRLGRREMILA